MLEQQWQQVKGESIKQKDINGKIQVRLNQAAAGTGQKIQHGHFIGNIHQPGESMNQDKPQGLSLQYYWGYRINFSNA